MIENILRSRRWGRDIGYDEKSRGKLNNESLLHVHVPKISSVENLLLQQKKLLFSKSHYHSTSRGVAMKY